MKKKFTALRIEDFDRAIEDIDEPVSGFPGPEDDMARWPNDIFGHAAQGLHMRLCQGRALHLP